MSHSKMISSKLTEVFNSLPPEAQQTLVEKHLAGLLDSMPKEKSKKVLSAATRLQRKYNDAPKLDLRAKTKQISSLLEQLGKDAKISFIKERSNRDELLSEIVHSLVSWLNDIWSLVYEHNVNFLLAHTCLLFVADALAQLSESSTLGGCKCSVMNLPVDFILRNKNGKVLKRFHFLGPQNIDRILLWIWRDLFVSLFATGSARDKKKVPDFVQDIERILGVRTLHRLLTGGKPNDQDEDEDDEDEDEYFENLDDEDTDIYDLFPDQPYTDDNDSEYESDGDVDCPCSFHARYWSERLNRERLPLRDCVEKRLLDIFAVTPSMEINNTLLSISHDVSETEARISNILAEVAGDTADNLVAALEIHISNNEAHKIASLIKSHSYLLRLRDAPTLQCAVSMLDSSHYHARSLEILEKELHDCIRAIHAAVRSCFTHIEEKTNKEDLAEFLQLRSGTSDRKERVEDWVERVLTPSNGPVHLMAFAAMMVGLPMMPGSEDGDDGDMLSYVDLDQNDPDLDDLREEYRPNLKAVFDGWCHIGQTLKGGPTILGKVYLRALELMPWLRGSDVVTEMANRLRERPNKTHVLEAIVSLSSFAKMQRKKMGLVRTDQQRKATVSNPTHTSDNTQSTSAAPGTSTLATPVASPSLTTPPPAGAFTAFFGAQSHMNGGTPPPIPFPFQYLPGNMEDVD